MAKERAHIIAMRNGVQVGYVKSVSYRNNKFQLTNDKSQAKGYASLDTIQGEIDTLTKIGYSQGFIFIYD